METNMRVPDEIRVKVRVFRTSAVIMMLVCAAVRVVAMLLSYDPEPGYFVTGDFWPVLSNALLVTGTLLGLSSLIFIPSGLFPKDCGNATNKSYFASVYAAFIMLSDAAYRFYALFIASDESSGGALIADSTGTGMISAISLICIFASVGSAVSFFLRSSSMRSCGAMAAIGVFPVLRAICGLALSYFDMSVPMNSPVKLLSQFAMMSLMLFFLCEDRFNLPVKRSQPGMYFAISMVAVIISGCCGISGTFAYFTGAEDNGELLIESLFALTSMFYILASVAAYLTPVHPDGNDADTEEDGNDNGNKAPEDTTDSAEAADTSAAATEHAGTSADSSEEPDEQPAASAEDNIYNKEV